MKNLIHLNSWRNKQWNYWYSMNVINKIMLICAHTKCLFWTIRISVKYISIEYTISYNFKINNLAKVKRKNWICLIMIYINPSCMPRNKKDESTHYYKKKNMFLEIKFSQFIQNTLYIFEFTYHKYKYAND